MLGRDSTHVIANNGVGYPIALCGCPCVGWKPIPKVLFLVIKPVAGIKNKQIIFFSDLTCQLLKGINYFRSFRVLQQSNILWFKRIAINQ